VLGYDVLVAQLTERIAERGGPLCLVLVDGVPGCGKSSLAMALRERLTLVGQCAAVIENDWFIAPTIRDPRRLAGGMALALSGRPPGEIELGLLARFLDGDRLGRFQAELEDAGATLGAGRAATLHPQGAHWNLAHAPAWAGRSFELRPGAVVIVEGTLTRAAYLGRFPEALCVVVVAPLPEARQRFLLRNRRPAARRNLAFSTLAWVGPAYRLAAELIERDHHPCHLRVDLSDLSAPLLTPVGTRSASAGTG
jgi:hypothetical protein